MSMWQAWCDVPYNIFLLLEGFVERSCFLSSVWTFYSSVAHSYTLTVTTVVLGYIWTKFFLVFSSVGYRKITVTGAHVNWWKPFGSIPRTLTRSWLDTAGAWLSSGTCRITKWHTSSWAARYEFIQFSRGGRALSAQSTPKTSRYRESLTKLLFFSKNVLVLGGLAAVCRAVIVCLPLQQLENLYWQRDGSKFISCHYDGSYTQWPVSSDNRQPEPLETLVPYGQ